MLKTAVQSAELQSLQILNWIPRKRMNLLSRHMTELRLGKGEVLYRPGQPAKQLFCVLEGSVGLSLLGSKGNYLRLAVVERGEFFGISALVSGWRRVSRAMTLRESRVGTIDAKLFVSEICAVPWETFTALTNTTIKPLLLLSLRRALFLVEDLPDRVALALWEFAGHPTAVTLKGLLPSTLTHGELAAVVGASRPRVSLALKQLENRGLFVREGGQIRVQKKPLQDYLQRKYESLI